MTHEHRANGEHEHGPEHTHDAGLPDAGDVPVFARAEDSDLPPLPDSPVRLVRPVAPGWWD